jgi:hypothetical protein
LRKLAAWIVSLSPQYPVRTIEGLDAWQRQRNAEAGTKTGNLGLASSVLLGIGRAVKSLV